MTFLDREDIAEIAVHTFWAEASALGLPPGCFPERLETNLGNGRPLIRRTLTEAGASYDQANGCIEVIIAND